MTDGPWMVSEPHPQTGMITIVNSQGRVIAAGVPSKDDADFICLSRNDMVDFTTTITVDWKAFGRAVQSARKNMRYSQDELATALAISRNYIAQIERGTAANPSYLIVLTICRFLRLEMPEAKQ